MLSGRWASKPSDDGSLFIDADPDVFQHVLRYLQRGVLPVFWSLEQGFNYGLYAALLQEARYFGVQNLEKWIAEKKYLNTITIQQATEIVEALDDGMSTV